MKYNPGLKFIRDNKWVKIHFDVGMTIKKQVHKWCIQQGGTGRFYYHYASYHWWFENEQDAIMFKLKWGEYVN